MFSLRKNSIFCILFLVGCTTSSYKIIRNADYVTELNVSPNRVLLECEYQADNDTKGLYGFMLHILDEENSVLTIVQNNTLNKSDCFRRINKIQQILKTGKKIYVGAMGELTDQKKRKEQYAYVFPNVGSFYGNGQSLQFIVIANEKGLCYDAYSGDEPPCPREPFSLQGLKSK